MIRFDLCGGRALIYDDNVTEDGWIFMQDPETKKFYVWSNLGWEADGDAPDIICDTLEEVLEAVNSYT